MRWLCLLLPGLCPSPRPSLSPLCSHPTPSSLYAHDPQSASLTALVQKVQDQDRIWLKEVLGNSLQKLLNDIDCKESLTVASSNSTFDQPSITEPAPIPAPASPPNTPTWQNLLDNDKPKISFSQEPIPVSQSSTPTIKSVQRTADPPTVVEADTFARLRGLGYTRVEAAALKPSIVPLIINRQVQRPQQIPRQWLRERGEEKFHSDEVGQEVRWTGTPLTSAEKARYHPDEDFSGSDSDEEEEEEVPGLWPSPEEFKDMLLEESKLRVGVLGDWAVPLVRGESRWRLGLYEQWLQLLDRGLLGDRFDVEDPWKEGEEEEEAKMYEERVQRLREATLSLLEQERDQEDDKKKVRFSREEWFSDADLSRNQESESQRGKKRVEMKREEDVLQQWSRLIEEDNDGYRSKKKDNSNNRNIKRDQVRNGNVLSSRGSGKDLFLEDSDEF
jgi:hypothetical protein